MREKIPIPFDLMQRYREFDSERKTADYYGVHKSTVSRWLKEIQLKDGDNARITEDHFIQQTRTHRAVNLRVGQIVSVVQICEDYVKIRVPWLVNHIKVSETILDKVPL